MSIEKSEFKQELEHLEDVKDIIKRTIAKKNVSIEDYKSSITERKKFLWERQNEYFGADLRSAMNDEDFEVSILNKDIVKVYKLYRSLESPYFSRIDFERNGGTDTFYIGLTGVDEDYEPVVYDWRASVANLFYNYGVGEAKYTIPDGDIEGEIVLKRQFDIKMGEIIQVYDSTSNIRDEYLESVLADNTSEAMRNIVGTIQREQNEVIRYPIGRNLVVEGTSGSGKTSVALHRVAYILYNQKNLTNKDVLIFSPSEEFSVYISNVLPELGEDNVPTTTFYELAKSFLGETDVESLQEAAAKYYEGKKSDKDADAKYKLSLDYKKKIDEYLDEYFGKLKFAKKFGLKNTFISGERLNQIKDTVPKQMSFADKIERLSEKICAEFGIDEVKNARKMALYIRKALGIPSKARLLYEEFTGECFLEVPYEDITGLMYLYFEVMGYPTVGNVREVIIDEAQDYTPWQFMLIQSIFRGANYTILGDKNQVINPYHRYATLKEIASLFDAEYVKLNKAYRSSKEIVEYASSLIGDADVVAVRKARGTEVSFKETATAQEVKDDALALLKKGYTKVGIIVKTLEDKSSIESLGIDRVHVETVYNAKGLEYDACIVYTSSLNRYTSDEVNLLYIAVTRALHEVIIYNQKKS